MEHSLAVGTITNAARALIEQANGRVYPVVFGPSCWLVQLPDPQFCGVEQDGRISHSLLRIRFRGCSLIWQGESEHGPELTSIEKTTLKAERE